MAKSSFYTPAKVVDTPQETSDAGIARRLIPAGGADGEVLTKQSAVNYDADWEPVITEDTTTSSTPVVTGVTQAKSIAFAIALGGC